MGQTVVTLQPGAVDGKDSFIYSVSVDDRSNRNYGNHANFSAFSWTWNGSWGVVRSFIEFDLSSIPDDAIIERAELSLYAWDGSFDHHSTLGGSNEGLIQRVTSAWDEHTLNWFNQPTTTTANQITLPASTSPTQHYPDIDVTALIRDIRDNPSTSFGLMLRMQSESQQYRGLSFCSSDHANPALRPKLVVTFSEVPPVIACSALPDADLGEDATICQGSSLLLDAGGGFDSYEWNDGSNGSKLAVKTEGLYFVKAFKGSCIKSDSVTIRVDEPPSTLLEADDTLIQCSPDVIELMVAGSYDSYYWNNGSTLPNLFVETSGFYSVTVENACGIFNDQVNVVISDITDVFIPNVITPDGRGMNEQFIIDEALYGAKLSVFNRWGKLVFNSDRYLNNWSADGLPTGTYIYSIQANSLCGDELTYKGVIDVIK